MEQKDMELLLEEIECVLRRNQNEEGKYTVKRHDNRDFH